MHICIKSSFNNTVKDTDRFCWRRKSILDNDKTSASQHASVKDISLSMWSLTGEGSGSTSTPRAMLRRVLTIPSINLVRGQAEIGLQITFVDKIKIHWSTLIHKVFFDFSSILREEIGHLKQNQSDLGSEKSKRDNRDNT